MTLQPHLAWMPLKRKLAARGERGPRAPSIVDVLSRLPWQGFVAGSVASPGCPLALVAARVPLAVLGEDAQRDNTLATTRDGPEGVRPVGT
jgi:hypothetical protein